MPDNQDMSSAKVMELPRRLDLTNAAALRDFYLEADAPLILDASEVEVVTTAGLQVLIAGRDWAKEQDLGVQIEAPSNGFRSCLTELGGSLDRITYQSQNSASEVA